MAIVNFEGSLVSQRNSALDHIEEKQPQPRLARGIGTFLAVALLVVSGTADGLSQMNGLPTPWQHKVFALNMSGYRSVPKVDHGFLLTWKWAIRVAAQNHAIQLNSLADGSTEEIAFWIGGASTIWIDNVAVSPGQRIIVVGSFLRPYTRKAANFMAGMDLDGHNLQIVDMETYEPELVCAEKDRSVWTFGQDWGAERSDVPYSMLRNYSPDGRLLKSYLPNDTLPPVRLNFSTRLRRMGGASGSAFLRCGDESVGAFIGPVSTWAEVQQGDGTLQTWKVKPPAVGRVTGLALLGRHKVYCSFKTQKSVFVRGFFSLDLSRPSLATWVPIDGTLSFIGAAQESSPIIAVVGDDGPNLVYVQVAADFPKSDPVFYWSKLD